MLTFLDHFRLDMKKKSTKERQEDLARRTLALLLDNLDRKITLEQLVEQFGYSATYIKICFKNTYGMPVHQYIRRKRMERAACLLLEDSDGILEIAGKVGFENGSKFAKVFKDTFGMTPGKYRRMDRAQAEELLEKVRCSYPEVAAEAGSNC